MQHIPAALNNYLQTEIHCLTKFPCILNGIQRIGNIPNLCIGGCIADYKFTNIISNT